MICWHGTAFNEQNLFELPEKSQASTHNIDHCLISDKFVSKRLFSNRLIYISKKIQESNTRLETLATNTCMLNLVEK